MANLIVMTELKKTYPTSKKIRIALPCNCVDLIKT